jgi:hypothetical protein
MRSAWGVFKATRMSGIDGRTDSYEAWYHTARLEFGEELLRSWNAYAVPLSGRTVGTWGTAYGKLLLSTRRVLFEPMRNPRPVAGPAHARFAKHLVTALAWNGDRTTERLGGPMGLPLQTVARVEADDSTKWSLIRITTTDDRQRAFAVVGQKVGWGWRDIEQRDDAVAQIHSSL